MTARKLSPMTSPVMLTEEERRTTDEWLSPAEFGKRLDPPVHRNTVDRWCREGKIECVNSSLFGTRYRIDARLVKVVNNRMRGVDREASLRV